MKCERTISIYYTKNLLRQTSSYKQIMSTRIKYPLYHIYGRDRYGEQYMKY